MIGQYVYTRNDGHIIIGPHGNPDEGLDCVGRTDSIRREDLSALHTLSIYTPAVHKPGSTTDYLPHWAVQWLPSGSLAVGKVTYFPSMAGVRQRGNHVAHFYVLDYHTAIQVSEHIEQLFTLPFIDFDLTYPDESHDMAILTKLRDCETLAQCGAQPVETVALGTLMSEHLDLSADDVRNTLEAVADSVVHGNRQMLFTYDCNAENALWVCAQWLGWIYRLLPVQIRNQTNLAFPYHRDCASSAHLALIPSTLVRAGHGYLSYHNSDAPNAPSQPMGFNYLFVNSTLYHQPDHSSDLPELCNAEDHYFCAFWHNLIEKLCENKDPNLLDRIKAIYQQLFDQGWRDHLLLNSADGLELMIASLGNPQQWMELPPEEYRQKIYGWLAHLKQIMVQQALPMERCLKIMHKLMQQLYQDGRCAPTDEWLTLLKNTLETVKDLNLVSIYTDWAAVSCAKWMQENKNSWDCYRRYFMELRCADANATRKLRDQLMVEGDDARQAVWAAAGVSCGAEATMTRILSHSYPQLYASTDSTAFFRMFGKYGSYLDALPSALLGKMSGYFLNVVSRWIENNHLNATITELDKLYRVHGSADSANSNTAVLISQMAKAMIDFCQKKFQEKYHTSINLADLKELQRTLQEISVPALKEFVRDVYHQVLTNIRIALSKLPVDDNLLHRGTELLDVSSEEADWALYDRFCGLSLGLIAPKEEAEPALPEFLTAQWLSDIRHNRDLRPKEGFSSTLALCALDCLLNGTPLTEELVGLISPANGGTVAEQIRAGMFRKGQLELAPNVLFCLSQRPEFAGMAMNCAFVLLESYGTDSFIRYLDWLRDHRKGTADYLRVFRDLHADRTHLCGLELEEFLCIMAHFRDTFNDCPDAIPSVLASKAVKIFHKNWMRYYRSKPTFQRLKLELKQSKYLIKDPNADLNGKSKVPKKKDPPQKRHKPDFADASDPGPASDEAPANVTRRIDSRANLPTLTPKSDLTEASTAEPAPEQADTKPSRKIKR